MVTKKRVIDYILENTKVDGLKLTRSSVVKKDKWYVLTFDKHTYNAFNESEIMLWYKRWVFDSSMNKQRKKEVMEEFPVMEELSKYYGKYIIDGETWYIRHTKHE